MFIKTKPVLAPGSVFSLEVLYPLSGGACFLVHYGDVKNRRFILVDGGHPHIYKRGLGPRLTKLRDRWAPGGSLPVELAIITHYDMDRVGGIAQLLLELKETRNSGRPMQVNMKSLWFNHFLPIGDQEHNPSGDESKLSSLKDLIPQLAAELNIGLNEPFDYFVMPSAQGPAKVTLDGELSVTVIAPDASWLQQWCDNWRRTRKMHSGEDSIDLVQQTAIPEMDKLDLAITAMSEGFSSPEIELLRAPPELTTLAPARRSDRGSANLASIMMLLEFRDRRMLLCGDGRCDHIVTGLSRAGLLPPGAQLHLDILAVPHYGSRNNVSVDFFKLLPARSLCDPARGSLSATRRRDVGHDRRGSEGGAIHDSHAGP